MSTESRNFIQDFIEEDLGPGGRFEGKTIHTRFPPEPNGYLHIGHAKAFCIDFSFAEKYGGLCNLRMDDTNPSKEDTEYVESIQEDIKWMGFDWGDRFYFASDYFEEMYQQARFLIQKGLAFVCDLTPEQMRELRGTLTEAGKESPYRNRSIEENLDLFERMRQGEFPDGSKTLRAKIDMSSGNMNMRDPVLYRILRAHHHRTKNDWCIYPMYDYAHPIEDALEHITHSLCTLEFEDHRPLYDWVIEHCDLPSKPRQIEFSRLNITHTVMSKRKLRYLVENHLVEGWDDPRMPTLRGLRRRGYTPLSIRNFVERSGISKVSGTVEQAFLEHCLREDLNLNANRIMCVERPIPLEITNYPENQVETFMAKDNPEQEDSAEHKVYFSKHLFIEEDDFKIEAPKKYFRMFVGNEVRLKYAYIVRCTGYDVDENGQVTKVYATYDPESRGGMASDGRKVKGTIHFAEAGTALDCEIRHYDNLFQEENPDASEKPFDETINKNSLTIFPHAKIEAWAKEDTSTHYQFMRLGYYVRDEKLSSEDRLVFNRSVGLKDSFKA